MSFVAPACTTIDQMNHMCWRRCLCSRHPTCLGLRAWCDWHCARRTLTAAMHVGVHHCHGNEQHNAGQTTGVTRDGKQATAIAMPAETERHAAPDTERCGATPMCKNSGRAVWGPEGGRAGSKSFCNTRGAPPQRQGGLCRVTLHAAPPSHTRARGINLS